MCCSKCLQIIKSILESQVVYQLHIIPTASLQIQAFTSQCHVINYLILVLEMLCILDLDPTVIAIELGLELRYGL
jgi:hypothetical protein